MIESATFILQQHDAGLWIVVSLLLIVAAGSLGDSWNNADKVTKCGLIVITILACTLMLAIAYVAAMKAETPLLFWWALVAMAVATAAIAVASFAGGIYLRR